MIELDTLDEDNHTRVWWHNFIETCLWMTDDEIQQELQKWQSKYIYPEYCDVSGCRLRGSRLAFETEEAATLFVLRWT